MAKQESTVHPARPPSPYPLQALADALEAELLRLREARPHLDAKIQRAEHILTAHVAGHPRLPVIRCRVGAGSPRFLVRSLNASGVVYVVWPSGWSCSCPDFHRSYDRGATCKHVVACYALWKVARQGRSYGAVIERGGNCPMCENGIVRVGQEYVNTSTGEVVKRTTAIPCRRCKGGE